MENFTVLKDFPFRSVLSLRRLVEFWEEKIETGDGMVLGSQLKDWLRNAPELKQPITDPSVLETHKDLVAFLLGAAIPYASDDTEIAAAIVPYQNQAIYSTKAFKAAIDLENIAETATINVPGNNLVVGSTIEACMLVARKFYNAQVDLTKPMLITVKNQQNELDKVYKVTVDHRFCEAVSKGDLPAIDPQVLKFLTEKIYDLDLWLQYIRPDHFEFHGFLIMRLTDVTEEEMLSSIKYDLLRKDAVVNPEIFRTIQQKLRSIFTMPDLMLGLAYFDPNNNLVLNSGYEDCWKSMAEKMPMDCGYAGSVYERSWMEKRHVTIENLATYPYKSKVEEVLVQNNIRSLILAPLLEDGETIGLLELASTGVNKLNPVNANKVENVLPMFTVAVKRVKSDMETEVRALIQEECTAIHPTVQWRFFEAGLRLMQRRKAEPGASLEEIVFRQVYPFFGMVDIRNSSVERNLAIQHDLQENLDTAGVLLRQMQERVKLPLFEELIYKIQRHKTLLHDSLASGDEANVLDFLKTEINPVIEHFKASKELDGFVKAYKQNLDPDFGVVYKRRRAFEESLNKINSVVGTIIDEAEESAQQMFPHYFERYKTDGVEFTIYLGESLLQNREFNPFYLRNFRLWQLLLMCKIEKEMSMVTPTLANKLQVTQLVLVHDQPVTIRFRSDEKRFDVDGAYDIRYEIIKKRIDKALTKSTKERLTQPGKIAIVYSQSKIADEYRQYFAYLISKGLIEEDVENFELEDLPGASGLKALRITVAGKPGNGKSSEAYDKEFILRIEEALKM